MNLGDWLMDLSMNYSVEHIDDVESGTFIAPVTSDVYLVKHTGCECDEL